MYLGKRLSSIYLTVFKFVDVLSMLVRSRQIIRYQQPLLLQLDIELLILSLPPLFLRLSHSWTLPISIVVQKFSLLSSQVVQHSLVAGDLKLFVFLVFCKLREVVVNHGGWYLSPLFDSTSSLSHLKIFLKGTDPVFERPDQIRFSLDVFLNYIFVWSFFWR